MPEATDSPENVNVDASVLSNEAAPEAKESEEEEKEKLLTAQQTEGATAETAATAALVVVPPDGGWGWVVVAASFMCNFFVDGLLYSFGVFFPQITTELNASLSEVALVPSLFSGFYLLAGPFVSALTNKYGFRKVTIMGTAISITGFIITSFVDSVQAMIFFYGIVSGIGFGLIYAPSVLIVGFYFERWRALATGIAVCGSGIGTWVLSPVSATLTAHLGWRWTFRIHAGLIGICAVCGLLFRPLEPVEVTVEPDDEELAPPPKALSSIKKNGYPTAAEFLQMSKSTQSLTPSVFMSAVLTKTQSVPMIPSRKRTMSENSAVIPIPIRSRRGTVSVVRSRRGTMTKGDEAAKVNRPMYRDDIFFSGSLRRLPDYMSSQRDFMGYTLSVTRLPTARDLEEEEECRFCPEAVTRALSTLFDTSLLKFPSFIFLCLSGFLSIMGILTPFMYLQDRADKLMPESQLVWLVSVVGMTNTFGRIFCGFLSTLPCTNALAISSLALSLGGIATMISHLSFSGFYQFTYCTIFGLTVACFGSLRSILIVELLGIEKLTNAFGILLLFQGVGAILGPPIAAVIKESTGMYDGSFMFAGGAILLSGLLCIPLKAIRERELKKIADAAIV